MRILTTIIGAVLVPIIWLLVKWAFQIEDRYLPSPAAVARAVVEIDPPIYYHVAATWARLILGSALGIAFGLGLALTMHRFASLGRILMPGVQSMRAVPPMAMIPFFLLWFGFSEYGKFLLIVAGIGFNVAVAAVQIAEDVPERFRIFFRGIRRQPRTFAWSFALPRMLQRLLPTVRFSIATATGLVVVAELLGSQMGLGYLIQSARSTFATHTIFLAAILLGIISAVTDMGIKAIWRVLVPWNENRRD